MQQVAEFAADRLTPLGRIGGRVTHREQFGAHRVAPAVKQRLQLRGDALANEEFQVARLAGRADSCAAIGGAVGEGEGDTGRPRVAFGTLSRVRLFILPTGCSRPL